MGRALKAVRTRDLEGLFAFFGVGARSDLIEAHRAAIAARFAFEVREILRLCRNLSERERRALFREALRLSYQSAAGEGATAGWLPPAPGPGGSGPIRAA